jgi:replication-associated recombination protein RarA
MINLKTALAPRTLDDFAFSDPFAKNLLQGIIGGTTPFPFSGKCAICFHGTYGTGKTTLAKLMPELLETSGKLQKLNRGTSLFVSTTFWEFTRCSLGYKGTSIIEDITSRSKSEVNVAPSGWFYEILDEVDTLTPASQASLKSLMTEESNAIFLLTTNNPHKLDAGLRDRSHMIEMNQPNSENMGAIGRSLLQKMGMTGNEINEATMQELAVNSRGSMRDFVSAIVLKATT